MSHAEDDAVISNTNSVENIESSVNQLVVQTALIHVDAVEEDPAKHQAYDTAMTSYMLGVSRGYTYGGWAWVDETDNNGTIESDGIMQETEKKTGRCDGGNARGRCRRQYRIESCGRR